MNFFFKKTYIWFDKSWNQFQDYGSISVRNESNSFFSILMQQIFEKKSNYLKNFKYKLKIRYILLFLRQLFDWKDFTLCKIDCTSLIHYHCRRLVSSQRRWLSNSNTRIRTTKPFCIIAMSTIFQLLHHKCTKESVKCDDKCN